MVDECPQHLTNPNWQICGGKSNGPALTNKHTERERERERDLGGGGVRARARERECRYAMTEVSCSSPREWLFNWLIDTAARRWELEALTNRDVQRLIRANADRWTYSRGFHTWSRQARQLITSWSMREKKKEKKMRKKEKNASRT